MEEVQNQHADESFNKFNWKIENVSKLSDKEHFSPIFRIGGHKWQLLAFCRECSMNNYLSVYVVSVERKNWRFAQFSLAVVDQANNKNTLKKDTKDLYLFTEDDDHWGFDDFIRLKELKDPRNGYIKNDACIIEVEFSLNSIQDFKQEEVTESDEEVQERSFGLKTRTSNDTLLASMKFSDEKTKKRKKLAEDNSSVVQRNPDKAKMAKGNDLTPVVIRTSRDDVHRWSENRCVKKNDKNSKNCVSKKSQGALLISELPESARDESEEESEQNMESQEISNPNQQNKYIVEEEEEEVGGKEIVAPPQHSEKKPRTKRPPKGKHIPQGKSILLGEKSNGRPWGEAPDRSAILFGYKHSWAAKVCEMQDHKGAVKKLKHQKAGYWPLEEECGAVRVLVQKTGIWPAICYSQLKFDSVVVSAFRERFWPETNTFHFSFGEIAIIPDDVKQIQDLDLEGRAVCDGFDNNLPWPALYNLTKDTLGWERDEAEMEFQLAAGEKLGEPRKVARKTPALTRKILLANLREKFGGTSKKEEKGEVIDKTRARRTATAYLLYGLGTILFPDNTGNRVNACYLQFLTDLEKTREYSWGTGTLAYLVDSLRKASRVGATQIAGNVGLLQSWIYDHFPTLRPKQCPHWNEENPGPTGRKYPFTRNHLQHKEDLIVELRAKLDNLTIEDVVFDPYLKLNKHEEDQRVFSDVSRYNGPLFHTTGFVMYNPRRTLRQIGCVQTVVRKEVFKLDVACSELNDSKMRLIYNPVPAIEHWNNRLEADYQIQTLEVESSIGTNKVEEGYLEWYYHFGHPYVVNNDPEAIKLIQLAELKKKAVAGNNKGQINIDWKKLYYKMKKRAMWLAESMSRGINNNQMMSVADQRILHLRLKELHNPERDDLFEDLAKSYKRSRRSSSGAGTIQGVSEEESEVEDAGSRDGHHTCGRGQTEEDGVSARGKGPRTCGGGGTVKGTRGGHGRVRSRGQ